LPKVILPLPEAALWHGVIIINTFPAIVFRKPYSYWWSENHPGRWTPGLWQFI